MASSDIVLSICVPTFNRAEMLERNVRFHLQAFRAIGMPFEIVIVDDCSTDVTGDFLAGLKDVPEIVAHRRAKNAGFLDNYAYAMRRARGKFAIFLGDDDLLIPEKVKDYIDRLEADPRLGMIQAPWQLIDERNGGAEMGPFYRINNETRFGRGDHRAMLQFIFDFHVFPEFMIIRRDVLARSISSPCPFIFWAFLYTARALSQAEVIFMPAPFARVTAISADPRHQQGNTETMFQWDRYRGGLEYFASFAQADTDKTFEQRTGLVEQINRFMLIRQKIALRLLLEAGHWTEAYVLHHRIAAYDKPPLGKDQFQQIRQLAGVTTAIKEAVAFGAGPVVVDPMISDDMLSLAAPETRSRFVRPSAGISAGLSQAYLRMNPHFPERLGASDAIFDVSEYIEQYI